jgi:hypothetical protein
MKMNTPEPLISNKYIVDEGIIDDYIQKKNGFMCERNRKAILNILFTITITVVYYLDIISDLLLCVKYSKDGNIWWFRITLGIVVFSSLLNTFILFYYSYLQEFKFNWKKKQYWRIISKSFCLLFQLEMLLWCVYYQFKSLNIYFHIHYC